jgi:alpha-beta hydrolase superfamily lysophospholipase
MKNKIIFNDSFGLPLKGFCWSSDNPKANVILVTGLNEYASRYDSCAEFLNKNGYNVYCLDYYGQGENASKLSDLGIEPKDSFDRYVDDINAYKVEIKNNNNLPVFYLGHSMGSFILQELIIRYPQATKKCILIGTAGPQAITKTGYHLLKLFTSDKNWDKPCVISATSQYEKRVKNVRYPCAWISYSEENYIKYSKDPYTQYERSFGAQLNLLKGLNSLHKKSRMKHIDPDISILILVGKDDPVGNNTKTVKKLFRMYKHLGVRNCNLNIYPNMRHEILNERNHALVENDILKFLNEDV